MPFAAFPNPMNDLIKIRRTLKVANRIIEDEQDIGDDGTFGDALFLGGLYGSMRGSQASLQAQLRRMHTRGESAQGQRTVARHLRLLYQKFGFIEETGGSFRITKRGQLILAGSGPDLSKSEKKAWLRGLKALTLTQDTGASFRPLRLMLEILSEGETESRNLTFAFTADGESDGELRRVRQIVSRLNEGQATFEQELERAGITAPSARNSVKILPAVAEQIGLIKREGGVASLTAFGRTLLDEQTRHRPSVQRAHPHRRAPFFRIVTSEDDLDVDWKPEDAEEDDKQFDSGSDEERSRKLRERTDEHQETLKKLFGLFEGWRRGKGNFDLLTEKGDVALLHEVKTLREGDLADERLRIIDGVGKLLLYEQFDVPDLLQNGDARVQKVMVFSRKPNSEEHVNFLVELGVWVLWFDENGDLAGETTSLRGVRELLDED